MALLDELLGLSAGGPAVAPTVNDPWTMSALQHLLSGVTQSPFSPADLARPDTFAAMNVPVNEGITTTLGSGVPQIEVPRTAQAVPQFQTSVEPAEQPVQPQSAPARPVAAPQVQAAPAAAMPVSAPRQVYPEPTFLDRMSAFSSGYDKGGLFGAISAAAGGVDKAVAENNQTAAFFQQRGFTPEATKIIMSSPDLQKALLPMMFGIKDRKVHVVDNALVDDSGKVLYQGNPAQKLGQGWEMGEDGRPRPIPGGPADPKYIAEAAGARKAPITATEMKAINEAEDAIPALQGTIENLKAAKALNPKTFSGLGAETGAQIGTSGVPGSGLLVNTERAKATAEWQKLMKPEALTTMANTLKGATTDFELRQYVELLADPYTDKDTRSRIIDRMITLAERQKGVATTRLNEMRDKSYYKPGGGSSAPQGGSPAPAMGSDPLGLRK